MNSGDQEQYKDMVADNEESLNQGEYLGTFRWKPSLKFAPLVFNQNISFEYFNKSSKWADYLENRVDFTIQPHLIDALSFPLTIISSLAHIFHNFQNYPVINESTINFVLIGASQKAEERIATESNYFDEIYYYIKYQRIINLKINSEFKLNLFFVGEEIKSEISYSSSNNSNIKYFMKKKTFGEFMKEYALDFNKSNTIIYGLNTGFGAGYLKLTLTWIEDLIKLLKFGYLTVFSYTNDFEDYKGENAILEKFLKANFKFRVEDNSFKLMTTYQNSANNELWSCGNQGFYCFQGAISRNHLVDISKLKREQIEEKIKDIFIEAKVEIK